MRTLRYRATRTRAHLLADGHSCPPGPFGQAGLPGVRAAAAVCCGTSPSLYDDLHRQRFPIAREFHGDLLVRLEFPQHRTEGTQIGDVLAVDTQQNITGLQTGAGRRASWGAWCRFSRPGRGNRIPVACRT